MPTFTNPYSTSLPDLREALNFMLQNIVQGSLGALNDSLARDGLTPIPAITSGQVVVGDPDLGSQTLICIIGGGKDDAVDMEIESAYLAGGNESGSYGESIYTTVKVLLYKNDLAVYGKTHTALEYVQAQETTLARIAGHLRKRVFNSMQYFNLQLLSQEHYSTGDVATGCHVKQVKMGLDPKSFAGGVLVPSATMLHVCEINTQVERIG